MSSLAKHVIRRPRPYRCIVAMIIAVLLSISSLWLFMQQNSLRQIDKLTNLHHENERLGQQCDGKEANVQQLKELNSQLKLNEKNHRSEVNIQIATTEQLQIQLEDLQQQLTSLNKEVLFYQSITQGDGTKKLQVREVKLHVEPNNPNFIHYRIVITQGQKINNAITGEVNILLTEGSNEQAENHLVAEHALNLRHVQLLEGQIEIVNNIEPVSITIELKKNKKTTLSQTFDWHITPNN